MSVLASLYRLARSLSPPWLRARAHRAYLALLLLLPLKARIRLQYFKAFQRLPRLRDPQTFSEKIQARKLQDLDLTPFVDKVRVKDFVRKTVGGRYVVPTLYHGAALPPVSERTWLPPFVIKTSHSSGGNIFVRDEPDWDRIEPELQKLLDYDFGAYSGETFYGQVQRQILIEPFIGADGACPNDYKFFMFDGELAMVEVDVDREHAHQQAFMDPDWNQLPLRRGYPVTAQPPPRPRNYDEMVEVASALSRGWDFVRVDLYDTGERVFFGEMTFAPSAGLQKFYPHRFDEELGRMWPWHPAAPAR